MEVFIMTRHRVNRLTLFSVLFLFSFILKAQDNNNLKISKLIKAMEKDSFFMRSSWGISVIRVKDGTVLAARNEAVPLLPASSLKIAVTYPAWKVLGPEYHFQTRLLFDGDIKDSILHGNLFLQGRGDPTLGSRRFANTGLDSVFSRLYRLIHDAGIRQVAGGVIADPSYYGDETVAGSWTWEDIGNYYGAGVSGLNINENQCEVIFKPSEKEGEPAKVIRLDPPVKGIEMDNRVLTGPPGSGDQVVIYGGPYDDHRVMRGTVPAGVKEFIVKASLPDPALQAGQWFQHYLILRGLSFSQDAFTLSQLIRRGIGISQDTTSLGMLLSPSLKEIVEWTHEKSVNLFADAFLFQLGKVTSGVGGYHAGSEAVKSFWKKYGLDTGGWILKDGSGLSVSNRISPRLLSEMMRRIVIEDRDGRFLATLNKAGQSGDLKEMFPTGKAVNNLMAKSGYMKTVRSYTGTLTTAGGEQLAFAIIVNHSGTGAAPIKGRIKQLLEALCNLERE